MGGGDHNFLENEKNGVRNKTCVWSWEGETRSESMGKRPKGGEV